MLKGGRTRKTKPTKAVTKPAIAQPRQLSGSFLLSFTNSTHRARNRVHLHFSDFDSASEGKSKAYLECAVARQLGCKIQGIQSVILIRQIEQPNRQLGLSPPEPTAGKNIELPKIIAELVRRITLVALRQPQRLGLTEEAGGMIVIREKV